MKFPGLIKLHLAGIRTLKHGASSAPIGLERQTADRRVDKDVDRAQ
jgi:hypothetical protein